MENNNSAKLAYINGQSYDLKDGETILSFVRRHTTYDYIPTLCDAPNLEPFGSCRVCSVEVGLKEDGPYRTQASCHTPTIPGSYIVTDSEKIQALRKNIVELVLTDHPMECDHCSSNNNCELQTVANRLGVKEVRYPEGKNHFDTAPDLSHPYMRSDLSKCINCYRCIRACDEVQGELVLSMMGRGFNATVIKGNNVSYFESDCVSCGACAQACPTDAITDIFDSKSKDFDDKIRTTCTYCGVGCNLEVAVKDGKVKSIQAPFDAEVNMGHTCLKGRYAFSFYNHPDRITKPLIRKNGVLEPVSWDEAYQYIATRLTEIKTNYGPNAIAGISSARCTNEENYLMQKFIRAVIGTNNIDCCARVCHSPTALGMQKSFGIGAATNSIEEIKDTDCILVIGANPTDAHPVTGSKVKQHAMKGKTTIVIDPRRTTLAKYATYHLALRPGTNVALLNMMLYYIISEGLENQSFIENRTAGYEAFKAQIMALDMDALSELTQVDKALVRKAAIAYATSKTAMAFHGLGVTEHTQGTYAVMLISDLALITGHIGKRATGVNPLRGQNNVQGAADMGCQPYQGAGYLNAYDPEINMRYELAYNAKVPMDVGLKIPEMFEASIEGKLKALWLMGEDVVQSDPNTNKVIQAMESLDLLIVQEIFITETAKYADVVLPGATFLEKSGTFTNGERRIQRVNKAVEPLPGTKSDGQIISEIMNIMGYPQSAYDAKEVLKEIAKIVPFFAGVTWENLGKNGKQWPVKPDGTDTKILHDKTFPLGKGQFNYIDFQESEELLAHGKTYPYIITTNRNLEHYNAGTMTRRTNNALIVTEDVLLINPVDAANHLIHDGDLVCVESPRGKVDIQAKITDEVRPGILSTTFHFPEVMLNIITSDVSDIEASCPEYKVVAVNIRKSKGKYKAMKV